jgi:hypothetical protein
MQPKTLNRSSDHKDPTPMQTIGISAQQVQSRSITESDKNDDLQEFLFGQDFKNSFELPKSQTIELLQAEIDRLDNLDSRMDVEISRRLKKLEIEVD